MAGAGKKALWTSYHEVRVYNRCATVTQLSGLQAAIAQKFARYRADRVAAAADMLKAFATELIL
jgi:hypothetical protein